ncbi:MAG: HEAT repeat domain-containing protein [Leptospiraceae bacterium]|nr:HEAT repeat domain-containing protein [Leptospiraceae bacterium]
MNSKKKMPDLGSLVNLKIKVLFPLLFSIVCYANTPIVSIDEPSPSSEDEQQDSQEQIGNVQPSNTSNRKSKKKHEPKQLTEEQILKKKDVLIKQAIFKYGSHKERKEAMREAVRFPKEYAEEIYALISHILATESDMSVKIAAIRTLSEVGYKKEPNILVSTLSDKNDDVKEAGIFAIQKLKVEEGGEELLKLLKNSDFTKNQTIINNAITALGELESGKQGVDFLESKFREKTTHPNVRSSIALYFGKVKAIKTEAALQDVLIDEMDDPTTRAFAANALGKMHSYNSIPKLREVLEKINETKNKYEIKKLSNLKLYCIGALIALGDNEILKELISYAKDDDPNVRIRAMKQLAEIGNPEAIELLEYKAQRDPSKKVQDTAKKLLEEINQRKKEEPKRVITPASP